MQKKQKIKPENQKLKNYLKVPFRSPSRSSFVLNSRTAATWLPLAVLLLISNIVVFLAFLI